MTQLEPAYLLWADIGALKLLMAGMLDEMLERAPDRRQAAEAVLHRALNSMEELRLEGVPPDTAEALREAIGARVSVIVAGALDMRAAT